MRAGTISLGDLLGARNERAKLPLPEAMQEELLALGERYKRYLEAPLYKVGDWVTPFSSSGMRGTGLPHLVVETRSDMPLTLDHEVSSSEYGRRADVRVLSYNHESYTAWWMESWFLVPWDPTLIPKVSEVE